MATMTLRIEIPHQWLNDFTLPVDFGRVQPPDQYVIEDDQMEAEAICVVGWIVWSNQRSVAQYIVGTVIRQRVNGQIEELDPPSHGHVYIKTLPSRRIVSATTYDRPYEIALTR